MVGKNNIAYLCQENGREITLYTLVKKMVGKNNIAYLCQENGREK
jgi:hypothetical protein